jgi:endonuclease/exonuclease/phosphatase family metal-dependent hydrolase
MSRNLRVRMVKECVMVSKRSRKICRSWFFCLVSFVTLVLFLGCEGGVLYRCSARPFEDSGHIKVMSFNIRYGTADDGENSWEKRREMVFDVICGYKGDVVGLQEALRFQIDEIRRALPEYGEVGVGREDGKKEGEYCCILYRKDRFKVADSGTFWFSNSPWVPGSIHWGNECTRICTWARLIDRETGEGFYVYNVHLDHVSQVSREKSAELLAKKIDRREHTEPFVVTGDFNAAEDNKAIHYLRGWDKIMTPVVMADTYRIAHPLEEKAGTFHGFEGRRSSEKIDYIFTDVKTRVFGAEIVHTHKGGRYPSDHFPVTAEVDLIGKKKAE